jgi:hypothetical protein
MKSKDLPGLLINPFTRIAGWQAFGIGLASIVLMGFIGAYNGVAFDGVLDMHVGGDISILNSFLYIGIDMVSLIIVMWITGLIVSRNFRFVDILGTITLAKAPFLILAIAGYFVISPDTSEILKNPYIIFKSISLIVLLLLSLPVIIWNIVLIYNAFKISCDVKGN